MKATKKILAGIGMATLVGLVVYLVRRKKTNRMRREVADQGYETAHDILFPRKSKRAKKQQYGRVFPS